MANGDVQQVRLLILAKDVQKYQKAAQFLTRRGWPTDCVGTIKQAVEFVVKYRPDFVLVSMSHPNPNAFKLPNLLKQTFNVNCIAFGEDADTKTLQKLNTVKLDHVFFGAVSGPSIHMRIKKILLEEQEKTRTQSNADLANNQKESNRKATASNLAQSIEERQSGSPKKANTNSPSNLQQAQSQNTAQEEDGSYWNQNKKTYGSDSDPNEVDYKAYQKPKFGGNDTGDGISYGQKKPVYGQGDSDSQLANSQNTNQYGNASENRSQPPSALEQSMNNTQNSGFDQGSKGQTSSALENSQPSHSNSTQGEYCKIEDRPNQKIAYMPNQQDTEQGQSSGYYQKNKAAESFNNPQGDSALANSQSTGQSNQQQSALEQSQLSSEHTQSSSDQGQSSHQGQAPSALEQSMASSSHSEKSNQPESSSNRDDLRQFTNDDQAFNKAKEENLKELKPHLDSIKEEEEKGMSIADRLNNSKKVDPPFKKARQKMEEVLTEEQKQQLQPDKSAPVPHSYEQKRNLEEGTDSPFHQNNNGASSNEILDPAKIKEMEEAGWDSMREGWTKAQNSDAEEQQLMDIARANNILAPDSFQKTEDNNRPNFKAETAKEVLDLRDPFINPMGVFFDPKACGIDVKAGIHYTVPPELFDRPDFALSIEGELPTPELDASNVDFREGSAPDREMKAIASVVDDGFREVCQPSANQAQEIEELSKIGIISTRSESKVGYVLIATPESYEDPSEYLDEVKKSIEGQKNIKNVQLKFESSFYISVNTVEFKNWAKETAEFLSVLQHGDVEVAMAFVEMKEMPVIKKSKRIKEMSEVDIASLIPDLQVNYRGYIKLDKNDKLILYIKDGRSISLKQKTKLLEKNVTEIFIPEADVEKFRSHYATALLNEMIDKYKQAIDNELGLSESA